MTNQTNKASSIQIQRARLSFIWAEILPNFLSSDGPGEKPFSSLTREFSFPSLFDEALAGGDTKPRLSAPWIPRNKQHFWMRYLIQGKLNEVRGAEAWKYLVPLRVKPEFRIKGDWFGGSCFIDAFYYPFGVATAITFKWKPGCSLEDLIKKAFEFKNRKYSVVGDSSLLSLEQVADNILVSLRQNALGADSIIGNRTQVPLSLITIVEAENVTPDVDVRKNDSVMKALEVLTSWPSNYKYLKLPNPYLVCLSIKSGAPAGSALYSKRRGRAVWLPALFIAEKDPTDQEIIEHNLQVSKLFCYHRNLFFASLQTESLGLLISYTAKLFAEGKHHYDLTNHHKQMALNAAKCLKKLYLGDKEKSDTWRSASVQRQIDDNYFEDLQTVLEEFDILKLTQVRWRT